MIEVEYALVDELKFELDPINSKLMYLKSVAEFSSRGYDEAERLESLGHKNLRVIMDSEWEIAITCDDCRLWACITRDHPLYKLSEDSRSGSLLEVVECDPKEVRRRFGKSLTAEDVLNFVSESADITLYGEPYTDDSRVMRNKTRRIYNAKRTKKSGG